MPEGPAPNARLGVFHQRAGVGSWPPLLTSVAISTFKILLSRVGCKITVRRILAVLALLTASSRSEAACLDPETASRAAVSITRYLSDEERKSQPKLLAIRGSGWFVSSRLIVTVAHVVEAMHLSTEDFKDIEIRDRESTRSMPVRLSRLAGTQTETIAVLELKSPVPDAQSLRLRMEPLLANEPVVSVAYAGDRLRVADGRFVEYGAYKNFTGAALFELYDGDDRLALDYGASGTPVLDCQGRVVAVVSNILTRTIQLLSSVRVSTPWGYPNVASVPIQVLKEIRISE